jgi:GT2 family glycosyltransferase
MAVYTVSTKDFNKRMKHSTTSNKNYEATVGIVLPCYNLDKYIHEALESIKSQTFTDFLLVVVDDASTDPSTGKTLKELSLPKNAELIFEKKNLGLSGIRNKYMTRFKTKYVLSFDPDDILEPLFLEKCVSYLENNPNKAAVATWLNRFGIESGTTKFDESMAKLPEMLVANNYLGSCLLRKAVFEEIGGYDTAKVVYGAEDYNFWLFVLEHGWELGVIPEPLFNYRKLQNSSSFNSAQPEKAIAWRKYITQKHLATYEKYLTDTVAGFEKRASESHAGYIDLLKRYEGLLKDYTTLHTYVEDDLLPKMRQQELYVEQPLRAVAHKLKRRLSK